VGEDGRDWVTVDLVPWQGQGTNRTLYTGPISGEKARPRTPRKAKAADAGCPTCGKVHAPCTECGAPTRCPVDEPGEPFTLCDICDAKMADARL